jgi:multidrug efflux pump subunit AcrB
VSDVARVVDGFEEGGRFARFDGHPAVFIQLKRVGDQRVLDVARAAKAYVERERINLPAGIQMALWDDNSVELETQIDMMLRNATFGFALVIVLLAVFLKLRVAFWVAVGIPISVAGGLAVMPHMGLGINILTVFSFIMALGILVDDAIVTGENIYTHQERDPTNPLQTAISGAQEVATPVIFGVLTTIAAFAPFALIQGQMKFMTSAIGGVMVGALFFSLVESKLVLPSHLAHWSGDGSPPRTRIARGWARFQSRVARRLRWVIEDVYGPAARVCVEWRYVTTAVSLGIFVVALSAVGSGHVKSSLHPVGEMNVAFARLTMPLGTPMHETAAAVQRVEEAAEALRREIDAETGDDEPVIQHVLAMVGTQAGAGGPPSRRSPGANSGQVTLGLSPIGTRDISSKQIAERWRERAGAIPGVEELTFTGSFHQFGDPIAIELRGDDNESLEAAAAELVAAIERYPGVYDVRDSHLEGKEELRLDVLPAAETLGITREDIGRQVRQAFYGAEVQRMQRGRDEVKVMVRYPAEERRSLVDVESLRIRLPDGTAAPLGSIALVERSRGPASIFRHDRKRKIDVTANVDDQSTNTQEVIADLVAHALPAIMAKHPGVSWAYGGEQQERVEAFAGLRIATMVALGSIFALLAIPLRSYLQPVVIMLAIPFGYVGAVIGHAITGYEMTFLSLIGVLACAGVVVNDSLVLVTFLNRVRKKGESMAVAAVSAGQARFRAIMLTSITTFAGLLPIMLEPSAQAQLVIPMAISLAFGVLIATIFTLLLVPAAIVIAEDGKQFMARGLRSLIDLYRADGEAPRPAPPGEPT